MTEINASILEPLIPNWGIFTLSKLRGAKKNAGPRGIQWDLSDADIAKILARANGKCEVTGKPFVLLGNGKREPWAPSLDRIDSTKGYTFNNVRLVAVVVNYALHEFGDNIFFEMAEAALLKRAERGFKPPAAAAPSPVRDESLSRITEGALARIEALEERISFLESRVEASSELGSASVRKLHAVSFGGETHMSTSDFAALNGVRPQTLRAAYCTNGSYGDVVPIKNPSGRLRWPAKVAKRSNY